eukprot:SAG31_NODE_2759_length_5134_cov_5.037736_4_plen_149_part_00
MRCNLGRRGNLSLATMELNFLPQSADLFLRLHHQGERRRVVVRKRRRLEHCDCDCPASKRWSDNLHPGKPTLCVFQLACQTVHVIKLKLKLKLNLIAKLCTVVRVTARKVLKHNALEGERSMDIGCRTQLRLPLIAKPAQQPQPNQLA